jgi:chemotaxis protein methyltransferase CheR
VKDLDCVSFLQWALPRRGLRWEGFRKVRRQVCRRIDRRIRELGLAGVDAYRDRLESHPGEWERFETLCRVSISRFRRDRGVFDHLADAVLPELAERARRRPDRELRCWSAGCASGEEPYSLALIWKLAVAPRLPDVSLRIVATDADPGLLERAERACYPRSSLRELEPAWIEDAFERRGDLFFLEPRWREGVELRRLDLRRQLPDERFDLLLCRNLVFTYFDDDLQRATLTRLRERLEPGGVLVIGSHEKLPEGARGFRPSTECPGVHERIEDPAR